VRSWGSLFAVILAMLVYAASAAGVTPNDPTWSRSWGQRQVNMPLAWDITTGDPRVVIAVVDTGVLPTLADLQGALVPGWDFIANDWTRKDPGGHGTLSATIAVGRGNNGKGVAGYCWQCRLMPVRVSYSGTTFEPGPTALGIRWAADHGARVISLGFSDEATNTSADPQVAAAVAYAAARNVLVIASSGNTGNSLYTHPAADPGAYAVAGTDPFDALYPWSTLGPWVPLAAPGCQWGVWARQGVFNGCGSSVSAPAVAGIVGLMLSVNSSLTPAQLVSALRRTAVPVAGIGGGRVDAYQALLAVGGTPGPAPPPPPPPLRSAILQPPRPRPPAAPRITTRVHRGLLRSHWHVAIKVRPGRVGATLRSSKAGSCTVSLKSGDEVWLSAANRRDVVSLAARVPAGRYGVDVWCQVRSPRRAALQLSALFA
jgi:subtilisin family serine protease